MKLPKSFDDLTVSQYQEVNLIIKDNDDPLERLIKILSCLSGLSVEQVEGYTPKELSRFHEQIGFIYNPESISKKIVKRIFLNQTWYCPVIGAEKLKAGQVITLKHLDQQNKPVENFHKLLACLYVEMDKLGNPKAFDSDKYDHICEDMKLAKMGDVYGTLFFYTNVLEKSSPVIQTCLNEATETLQGVMPEVMEWAKKNPSILKKHGLKVL